MFSIILYTCLIVSVMSMPFFDDKKSKSKECIQTVMGDFSNPTTEVVDVPSNCSQGLLNFHYTTSPVDMMFRRQGVYIVCITSKAMPGWEHFYIEDMTEQRNQPMGAPTKQRQVCTYTTNGNLYLRIEPKSLMYMIQIPYVVIDFNFPLKPFSQLTDSKNV